MRAKLPRIIRHGEEASGASLNTKALECIWDRPPFAGY